MPLKRLIRLTFRLTLATNDHTDEAFIGWPGLMINVLVDAVFQVYHVISIYRSVYQGFNP